MRKYFRWDRVAADRERKRPLMPGGPGRESAGPQLSTKGLFRCGHCGAATLPYSSRRLPWRPPLLRDRSTATFQPPADRQLV